MNNTMIQKTPVQNVSMRVEKNKALKHDLDDGLVTEEFKGKPLKNPVQRTKIQGVDITTSDKKNLAFHKSQRPLDKKRAEVIKESWNGALGIIHVCEVNKNSKYYYYILDGQHRANANPNKRCVCIIHQEKPHKAFLQANDPSACKPLNWDDRFWANFYGGEKKAKELYDKFKNKGLNAERLIYVEEGGFAGIGNVFKIMSNMKSRPKTRGRKSEWQKVEDERRSQLEKEERFNYIFDLMFEIFDARDFKKSENRQMVGSLSGYQTIWTAFAKFINNNTNWSTLSETIVEEEDIERFKINFENHPKNYHGELNPTSLCSYAADQVSSGTFARDAIVDLLKKAFINKTEIKRNVLS